MCYESAFSKNCIIEESLPFDNSTKIYLFLIPKHFQKKIYRLLENFNICKFHTKCFSYYQNIFVKILLK